MLENHKIGINCLRCGYQIEATIGWLESNYAITCPGCDTTLTIVIEKLFNGIEKAARVVAKLRKSHRDGGM